MAGTVTRDVVNVAISIATPATGADAFGIPMILNDLTAWPDRVQSFTSADAVLEAGASLTDPVYIAVKDMFNQTSKDGKKISLVKVGKKKTDANGTATVTFDADATAGNFTLDIALGDAAAVSTGLIAYDALASAVETAIETVASVTSCTVTLLGTNPGDAEGFTVEFDGADATKDLRVTAVDVSALTSVTTGTVDQSVYGSATETWVEAYQAVKAEDNVFINLLPTTRTKADILALAAAIESDVVLGWFITSDADVLSGTAGNVAETLKGLAYTKSNITYTGDSDNYLNCGWVGATSPDFIGGINVAYYQIAGIATDTLTSTQITNLVGNNCNRFETIGGKNIVPGTAAGSQGNVGAIMVNGQFIDYIWAKLYLETVLQNALFNLLTEQKKVPSTTSGLDLIESVMRSTLQTEGVNRDIIEPDTINITMPNLDTYSAILKSQRSLEFDGGSADLQGAFSKITITYNLKNV
jgi:hypothetical protein